MSKIEAMLNRELWIQLVDFGLLVFIWTIQLVVYPGFRYFPADSLLKWHGAYTGAVSTIVMPLMITQLTLHTWRVYDSFSLSNLLLLLLVIGTWAITFVIFVPLHNKISLGHELTENLASLVSYNWIRTALWSLIFLIGLSIKHESTGQIGLNV
jgi:hypothetical protein